MLAKDNAKVDKVLDFEVPDSVLVERVTGRWIHPESGRSYHTKFAPPKVPGKDDVSWHLRIIFVGCVYKFRVPTAAFLHWLLVVVLHGIVTRFNTATFPCHWGPIRL
jgi:adenylate kinase family enzyme